MFEALIVSLIITVYIIIDDLLFSATLKSNTPLTSELRYIDCETEDEAMDAFEDYCNYRMNNKGE